MDLTTFAIYTFKGLYTAFLKKNMDDILWPWLKGIFKKDKAASLESCFDNALNKVLKRHSDLSNDSIRNQLTKEIKDNQKLLKEFPHFPNSLTSELYENYVQEIDKNNKLKTDIKYHLISLADEALKHINDDFTSLPNDITQLRADIHSLLLNKGLGADVKIVEGANDKISFDEYTINRESTKQLVEMLDICKLLNLYGSHLTGKDVLAQEIAQAAKKGNIIIINLHYKTDINVIELLRNVDTERQIIVISNLNYRFGDEYSERIIKYTINTPLKSSIIITTLDPIKEMLDETDLTRVMTFEVKDFSECEMENLAKEYGMPQDFPLRRLIFAGFNQPLVANACFKLCQKEQWKSSKVLENILLRVQKFDLTRKMSFIMEHTVSDMETRHLAARISLLHQLYIPSELVHILADVKPSINGYIERLNHLIPDWLQQSDNKIRMNRLLYYWQYGLSGDEERACFISAANYYLRKELLDPIEIGQIITQLSQVNKSETYRYIKIAKGFRKSRKISIFVVSTNKVPNTFSYAQRYINFLRTTRNFPAK